MSSTLLAFFVCSLLPCSVLSWEKVLVDIPHGTLQGLVFNTPWTQRPYYGFFGIPYAKAITHSTRFKASEPPEPWTGVFDATRQTSQCASYCPIRDMVVGEDDCLYLKVFTNDLNKNARKAVLVWIHGGEFYIGGSDENFFGPDYLMEYDIVLVMIDFRLGPFGFLSTEDAAAPGNRGLKDQTLALRWVRDNIVNFGGCPDRVTIGGETTGGTSAQYHMMSPMSAGLFAHIISSSGATVSPGMFVHRARETAFQLGKTLGIHTTDSAKLMEELDKISTEDIVEAQLTMNEEIYSKKLNGDWYAFVPCVEPEVGQERFLTGEPWELIKAGKLADVPYIAGIAMNDSLWRTEQDLERADYMNENLDKFVPEDLNITDPSERKRIGDLIKQFYFGDKPIGKDTALAYADLMTDIIAGYGTQIPLTILNSIKSAPVFNYVFAYEQPIGWYKDIIDKYDLEYGTGAVVGDWSEYIFYISFMRPRAQLSTEKGRMIRKVTKLITNFVITGNPTPTLDEDILVKWEPMGKEKNYMVIDKELKMEKNLFGERMKFWSSIYNDILGDYAKLF